MLTVKEIADDLEVKALISIADRNLEMIGYTEHGFRHSNIVSERAGMILRSLGYDERRAQLAEIAAYLHDIGNAVNRRGHAIISATLAYPVLTRIGMPVEEALEVVSAIGNHHEGEGDYVSEIAAALVIADKSDVHSSRVRNPDTVKFDIHDRVNYAARKSELTVSDETITLSILVDPTISSVMEYFEIFLTRMIVSRGAANFLNRKFELVINGVKLG